VKHNAPDSQGTGGSAPPYGPATPKIRRFLQRAAALDASGWQQAVTRYSSISASPAGRSADRALGRAIETAALHRERDALVGPVIQLAQRVAADDGATAEALLSAALSLLATPPLEHAVRATLYEPFADAIPLSTLDQ
jgi:hypothetical protein